MPLSRGDKLGPYEIHVPSAQNGRDRPHDRTEIVAIKNLRGDNGAQFQRET
jgi:hypothetical protein